MPFTAAQISFGGGELSPEIRARIDIAKYPSGAKTMRNFFVRVSGGANNRPGLEYVVEVKDSTKIARLVPFAFNVQQTYVLVFQEKSMRVIKDGGLVLEGANPITGSTAANPVVITSVSHGFSDGDEVFIQGVGGMIELNERFFIVDLILSASTTITGVTQANPVVITDIAHGYTHGDRVQISGIVGMTELNDRDFTVNRDLGTATTISGATQANPVEITDTGHPYSTGDKVYITAVVGMTELNDLEYTITSTGANTYTLNGIDSTSFTAYTSGGQSQLVKPDSFLLNGEDGTSHTAYVSGGTARLIDPDTFNLLGEDGTSHTAYTSGGTVARVFDLVTPYLDSEILALDYTQSNDVLTIVHPNHAPADLSRLADDVWVLTTINIQPGISAPGGVGATYTGTGTGIVYDYVVTSFNEETNEESIASPPANIASGDLSTSGDKVVVSWTADPDATQYNIYKAEDGSGFYGFIGSSNTLTFTDRNITPEFNDSPAITIRDPFSGTGNKPSTVNYNQGRRWYAASDNKPTAVWGSVSGNFTNFNVSKAVRDDDAVTATLTASQSNAIMFMSALGQFVVFTSGSEWLLTSSGSSALITPSTAAFAKQSSWGSLKIKPLEIGNAAVFVTGNSEADDNNPRFSMVRDIRYTLESDNYNGIELSVLSSHLFNDREVVSWDYAQVPYSLVWAILDNGILLSMTYVQETQLWAWARHDTTGTFESVASIREGGEDATYFIVRRKIGGVFKRYVERMHTRQFDDIRDWFGVDSGITHDVPQTITGATQANPVVVTLNSHGYSNGDRIDITDVLGMTELNNLRYKVANVTTNTFELQSNDDVPINIDGTAFNQYDSSGRARKAINTVTGLEHLEGETVNVLADGNVIRDKVVLNGGFALDNYYSRIHAGLPYICDLETLDANVTDPSGKIFSTKRKSDGVVLRMYKTRGGQVGSSVSTLYNLKWRSEELWGDPGSLSDGDVFVQVESKWGFSSRIFYRQADPLPATILSAIIDMDTGNG